MDDKLLCLDVVGHRPYACMKVLRIYVSFNPGKRIYSLSTDSVVMFQLKGYATFLLISSQLSWSVE